VVHCRNDKCAYHYWGIFKVSVLFADTVETLGQDTGGVINS